MATAPIVQKEAEKSLTTKLAERAERGFDLYLARRQLIRQTGEDTVLVPTSNRASRKRYVVHYGGDDGVEDCTCADFLVHQGAMTCKHITAVAFGFAARRKTYSHCAVCGASSRDKTLLGLRNDYSHSGVRYCLPHHPESMNSIITGDFDGLVLS
jgi:predicted nucleic acid-binding Zn finger protein